MSKFLKFSTGILVCLVILVTSGCEEDQLNKEGLLTAHPWKFEKFETNSANPDIQSMAIFANALLAASGAVWTFDEDGSHTLTLTNLDPPESETGTWELSSDGKTLILEKGTDDEGETTIRTLTSSKLVFEEESWDEELEVFYTTSNSWIK